MRKRHAGACAALMVLAAGWTGCSDDATGPEPVVFSDLYLTVHVDEAYSTAYGGNGCVFASGPSGEILATGEWSGPSTVILANPEVSLETVSLTAGVVGSPGYLQLLTQQGLAPRSEQTLTVDVWTPPLSTVELQLRNPPPYSRFTLASNGRTMSVTEPLPILQPVNFTGNVSDIFLRLDRERGAPLGGWIRGVESGDVLAVDLDDLGTLSELTLHTVALPEGIDQLFWSVTVDHPGGGEPHQVHLDGNTSPWETPSVLAAYLPAAPESGFRFEIHAEFANLDQPSQSLWTRGVIPTSFHALTGEMDVVNDRPDSARYVWTGAADRHLAVWGAADLPYVEWVVDGPAAGGDVSLPQLPGELQAALPDNMRETLALEGLSIEADVSRQIRQRAFWSPWNLSCAPRKAR